MEASNYVRSHGYDFLLEDMKLESSCFLDVFDSIEKGSTGFWMRGEVNIMERSVIIFGLL